jgi:general secretion pathway protein D
MTGALSSCGTARLRADAEESLRAGRFEQALVELERGSARNPEDAALRASYIRAQEQVSSQLLGAAITERAAGRHDAAESILQRLLAIDPRQDRARALLLEVGRDRRAEAAVQAVEKALAGGSFDAALALVESALKDNPRHARLLALQRQIGLDLRARDESTRQRLAETRPITLAFRDAGLQTLLEAISRSTGVNFILDKDVRPDIRATVFLRDTRIEDALELLARTNQLAVKVLDATTVLVYPNTPEKQREYQDLVIRAFYLGNVSAKQTAAMLQTMLKVRDPYVDERANLIIIRDTPERVRVAERLIALHDFGEPEVMLEVEVLEINRSRLTELGIRVPDSFSVTPLSLSGVSALTLDDLRNVNSSRLRVSTPTATLNLRREIGDASVLANPRIRAKNREKARILIGDKLPVVTTTTTSTGFVAESVQYLEVGLKLEVEPTVYLDDEVGIKVNLEVSSLTREVSTPSGSLAYQVGTRGANTALQLRDGETQLLAGLISNEDRISANRVPGIGDLPVVGRLFSSQKDDQRRTEIVLSITPRVIRNIRRPDINLAVFWSGSESHVRVRPLALTPVAQGAAGGAGVAARPAAAPPAASMDAPLRNGQQAQPGQSAGPTDPSRSAMPTQTALAGARPPAPVTLPQGAQWALRLDAPPAAAQDSVFAVELVARSDVAVRGMPVEIVFDATRLTLLDVEEGEFLRRDGAALSVTKQIQPESGRTVFGIVRNAAQGTSGTGVLATLRFRAAAPGSAQIAVRSASVIGAPTAGVPALPSPATVEVRGR